MIVQMKMMQKSKSDVKNNENKCAIDDSVMNLLQASSVEDNVVSPVSSEDAELPIERTTESKQFPKKGDLIQLQNADSCEEMTVLCHGGKAGGKYSEWYNVKNNDTGEIGCIDLGVQDSWRHTRADEEVNGVIVSREEHFKDDCMQSMTDELNKLKVKVIK